MKEIIRFALKDWSFYALVFLGANTWHLCTTLSTGSIISTRGDDLVSSLTACYSLVFYAIFCYRFRKTFLSTPDISIYRLALGMIFHTLKAVLCTLPLIFLLSIFDKLPNVSELLTQPWIRIIENSWFIPLNMLYMSGIAYVTAKGTSDGSFSESITITAKYLKVVLPLSILTFIAVFAPETVDKTQSTSGLFRFLTISLNYLNTIAGLFGIVYISKVMTCSTPSEKHP